MIGGASTPPAALTVAGQPAAAATTAGFDWERLLGRPPIQIAHDAVRARVDGRSVLVTGAAGSLGAPLSLYLAGCKPAALTLVDLHESSLFRLRQTILEAQPALPVRYVLADVRDRPRIQHLIETSSPHLLCHLAARKHVPWGETDPLEFAAANVVGARNVAMAAAEAGVDQLVYPSTDKAVDPPSFYGATKRFCELLLIALAQRSGPRATLVRFVNVLGSQGSAPETFLRQIASGRPLTLTDPRMRRYWITPSHAQALLLHAGCLAQCAVTVLPDCGEEIAVRTIAERMWQQLRPGEPEPTFDITGLRPGERLSEPIRRPDEQIAIASLPGVLLLERPAVELPQLERVLDLVEQVDVALAQHATPQAVRSMVAEFVREPGLRE